MAEPTGTAPRPLTRAQVLESLPQREPMILVDGVSDVSPERVLAYKQVRAEEPYFAGHFPGAPVMPGVLILEALAQAGTILVHRAGGFDARTEAVFLTGVDRARFRAPVRPGDRLELEILRLRGGSALWRMHGTARVGQAVVASADITAVVARRGGGKVDDAGAPPRRQGGAGPVHPTAVVAARARLHPTATVGPYAVIEAGAEVGPGCEIGAHAVVTGRCRLGPDNVVGPHAVLGGLPQIRGISEAAAGLLEVGARNRLSEFVTLHAGSHGGVTRLGDDNLLMAYCHVGHDCQVEGEVELANGVQLAGHVQVQRGACLGGLAGVHQFARVGALAFVGAGAMVSADVLPFCLASGDRARIYGLNRVGLRRRGLRGPLLRDLARAVRLLLAPGALPARLAALRQAGLAGEEVDRLRDFVQASRRGICPPARRRG